MTSFIPTYSWPLAVEPSKPLPRTTQTFAHLLAVSLFSFSCSSALAGFDECRELFPDQLVPKVARAVELKPRELCFDGFAVLYSATSKTPIYAVERASAESLRAAKRHKRERNPFYEEARLPSGERSTLQDYREPTAAGKRMDRGHVFPAGDAVTKSSFAQSFSLANMVPQVPKANQGPWNSVEQATRHYVLRAKGDVFIFTGPVFKPNPPYLGPSGVWVPDAMFKLVYDPTAKRGWAHWVSNSESAKVGEPISYEELSRRLGYDLLSTSIASQVR